MRGHGRRGAIIGLVALGQLVASVAGPFAVLPTHAQDASPVPSPRAQPATTRLVPPDAGELTTVATRPLPEPSPPVGELDIGSLADRAFAVADRMPAEDWEIGALADSLNDDPARAFQFVRDSIAFQAYPGILRGPEGTLAAHAGNAEDRALLLGTILNAMQVRYRFAWGELDDATAQRVAARTFETPVAPLDATDGSQVAQPDTTALALRARRDDALLRLALGDRLDGATGGQRPDLAAEVRHHVWIQVDLGPVWLDEDPTMPDARPGQTLTAFTGTALTLPAADAQTVTIELLDTTLQGGQLSEGTVLARTIDAASAAPSEIFLYFQPQVSGVGGSIAQVLGSATSYLPALLVNGSAIVGQAFPVKQSKDPFTGDLSTSDPVIAGLRLRITIAGPGMTPESATRVLLDRLPARDTMDAPLSADQLAPLDRATGPDALATIHHIAVSTGGTSLRALASQQGAVMDFIERAGTDGLGDYGLGSMLWPLAVADLGVVATSEHVLVPAATAGTNARAYIATPRVYLMSLGPDATPSFMDTQTDLLIDGVRIVTPGTGPGTPSTVAAQRLWYGVLQSALETQHAMAAVDTGDRGGTLMGASLDMAQPLTVLDDVSQVASAPGAPAALHDAVTAGLIALVPGAVDGTQVWWTVDPRTGETRAVLDPGLGGVTTRWSGRSLAATQETVQGKATGAGSRFARSVPRQGANNNPGRSWGTRGNGYYENGKYHDLNRPTPPPQRCGGGQEYVFIVGCVDTPMAWALRATVTVAVLVAVYCAYELLSFWIYG